MDQPNATQQLGEMLKGYSSEDEDTEKEEEKQEIQIPKETKTTVISATEVTVTEVPVAEVPATSTTTTTATVAIENEMKTIEMKTTKEQYSENISKKRKTDALKLLLQNTILLRETLVRAMDEEIEEKKERIKKLDKEFDFTKLHLNNRDHYKMNYDPKNSENTQELQKELEEKINKDYNMQNIVKSGNVYIVSPRKNIRVVIYPNDNELAESSQALEVNRNLISETRTSTSASKEKEKKKNEIKTKYYNRQTNQIEQGIVQGQTEKRKHQISWLAKDVLERTEKIEQMTHNNKRRRNTNDKYGW